MLHARLFKVLKLFKAPCRKGKPINDPDCAYSVDAVFEPDIVDDFVNCNASELLPRNWQQQVTGRVAGLSMLSVRAPVSIPAALNQEPVPHELTLNQNSAKLVRPNLCC